MLFYHFSISRMGRRRIGLLIGVVLFVGIILEIWTMNRLATFGDQIARFENAAAVLRLENQTLENEISEQSSLKQIQEKSKELGLKPVKQIEHLQSSNVALVP